MTAGKYEELLELEIKYGAGLAQQIIDEISKVEKLQLDYLDVKEMMDLSHDLRRDVYMSVENLRHWRKKKRDITGQAKIISIMRDESRGDKLFHIDDRICIAERHLNEVLETYRVAHSQAHKSYKRYLHALKRK